MGSIFGPVRFLLPVCRLSWFLYTLNIFCHIFLSNYWWQKSDIWSQVSYRYPISFEVFLDPSDSYFLFAEERGYHKWALAHSSSCSICFVRRFHKYHGRGKKVKFFTSENFQISNLINHVTLRINVKKKYSEWIWRFDAREGKKVKSSCKYTGYIY